MNLRDLERLLQFLMNISASDLDQRARRLRAARMLPQGGHGVNAPQISADSFPIENVITSLPVFRLNQYSA